MAEPKDIPVQEGVSLRDYLALNAPPVPDDYWECIEANKEDYPDLKDMFENDLILSPAEQAARWAYEYADEML
ncbi:MAG TPA: hypothetical protein VKT80_18910, partial [Chloroflexota bacterium]|nr:hypothetical protein [Chloroflexota bacterium]